MISEAGLATLRSRHTKLIEKAVEDATRWLGTAPIQGKSPETRWLKAFTDPKHIDAKLISDHKKTWAIQGVAGQPYEDMANHIRNVIQKRPGKELSINEQYDWPAQQVSELASKLGTLAAAAMRPRRDGTPRQLKHTSWSSKILLHAWPELRVHVWDSNARLSLNTRKRRIISEDALKNYNYQEFLEECENDLSILYNCDEFNNGLTYLIDKRGSVLKENCIKYVNIDDESYSFLSKKFLERRLYDKYLWHEADFIKTYL